MRFLPSLYLKIGFGIPVFICGCIMNGAKTEGDGFCPDDRILFESRSEYDRQSRIVKLAFWNPVDKHWISTAYTYNENGTVDVKMHFGDDLTSQECHVHKHDSASNSTTISLCPPGNKVLWLDKHDSAGRVIESWSSIGTPDSSLTRIAEYEYDDIMRMAKTYAIEDGKETLYSVTYNDEGGDRIKVERYNDSGEVRETELFEYSDKRIDSRIFEGSTTTQMSRTYLDGNGLGTRTVSCAL